MVKHDESGRYWIVSGRGERSIKEEDSVTKFAKRAKNSLAHA